MKHLHLTQDLLRATLEDRSQVWQIAPTVMAHLVSLCPICREEVAAWDREVAAGSAGAAGLSSLLRPSLWEEQGEGGGDEEARAAAQLQVLLELPRDQRLRFLQSDRGFCAAPLAEALLEEAAEHLPGGSEEAGHLAELAEAVIDRAEGAPPSTRARLRARARGHRANAKRARGDLAAAELLFVEARAALQEGPGPDKVTAAELDSFEGSLRRAQRRFAEARQLLERAEMTFRMADRTHEAGRVLLKLGTVLEAEGRAEEELQVLQRALATFDEEQEPMLLLMARHNLVGALCVLGQYEEARAELERHQDLYLRFPDTSIQLRLAWLEGKIARGLEEDREAESFLRAARHGFLKREQAYAAALVSLDLALLYLDQGRSTEIARLAEEILPVFRSLGIHRETLAAWMLLVEAVRQDRITATLVQELATYLRQAQQDPSHRFAPSQEE